MTSSIDTQPAAGTVLGAARRDAADPVRKPDRSGLTDQHREARARREAAPLGSDAYRAASEEVTRIEVAIAALEEPSPAQTAPEAVASA